MRAKDVEPIDRLIGRNIRFHRLRKQLSQTELAASIQVTYQQLQKYEHAANRISASRLFRIAQALEVPINVFFDAPDGAGRFPGPLHASPAPVRTRVVPPAADRPRKARL